MRVLVACKRGGLGPRDKNGRCVCDACVAFNRARWRAINATRTEYKKNWSRENPDKLREYTKKWISENPDKRRDIELSWKARNPDRVKNTTPMPALSGPRKMQENAKTLTRKRSASLRGAIPKWANLLEIEAIYKKAQQVTASTGIPHEVDHIIPLQGKDACGLHVENNLRILTRAENRSKGHKLCAV